MTDTKTKAVPSTGQGQKLLTHIVKREHDYGPLKDQALCGALWDRLFPTSKNICPECKEIAERDGHKWKA